MEILDSQAFTELVVLLWDVANWIVVWKQASKGVLQAIRLYRLVKSKSVVVAKPEMALDNKFVIIRWDNIRMLLERELNILVELVGVLKDFADISEVENRIMWIHDRARVFSVKKLSQLIVNAAVDNPEFNFDRIWKLKVPLKVQKFFVDATNG
ncbi:hypothetical protein V6N13_098516 [Hibiscus sabdariffa]